MLPTTVIADPLMCAEKVGQTHMMRETISYEQSIRQ